MGELIDGKGIAEKIRVGLRRDVEALAKEGIVPGLAVILVGSDPASVSYVTGKEKACAELGMYSSDNRLDEDVSEETLIELIRSFNRNDKIHGILVQLPLPKHLDEHRILMEVSPDKDVDGYHPMNLGKMLLGRNCFLPCTPLGIMKILELIEVDPDGKHAVVVGRGATVGKSLANLLISRAKGANATVTVCHSHTRDMARHTLQADILIAAAGSPKLITADMVKPGAVVIDVGINRVADETRKSGYRLQGDVDFEDVRKIASKITPVPGGVGPLTITMLLSNTIQSAQKHLNGREQ
jgi:methylenetetrahydrofolate dehydrogenase (NADP+)/methenyltetrahydrofolate cyclohydrolase